MRARAVLIFAALPCFIHAESRETGKILNSKKENLRHLVSCVESFGLSKCASAFGVWRAERALGDMDSQREHRIHFPWKKYSNLTNEELYSKLCDGTERLLQRRSLTMNISDSYSLELGVTQNGSLNIDVLKNDEQALGRGSTKKMQKMITKMLPLLLVPGLLMSAILPFFLPTLKMMTIAAGMINNMALTGAVLTLLRNNAFNDGYKKKVIYINAGYKRDKYEPLEDTVSEVIEDPFGSKFNDFETHDFRDYQLLNSNNQFLASPSQFAEPTWLQPPDSKVKNVQIVNDSSDLKWPKIYNFRNSLRKSEKVKQTPKTVVS